MVFDHIATPSKSPLHSINWFQLRPFLKPYTSSAHKTIKINKGIFQTVYDKITIAT